MNMTRSELVEWIIVFGLNAGEDYDFDRNVWIEKPPPKS